MVDDKYSTFADTGEGEERNATTIEIGERLREMDERTKHTPGPWRLGDDRRLPSGRTVVSADHVHVADVMERNSNLQHQECEANAVLIASAPAMQLVLQGLAYALTAILKNGLSADEARLCMVACNAPAMSSPYNTDGISLNQRCDQIAQDERTAYTALDAAKPFLPKEKETHGT